MPIAAAVNPKTIFPDNVNTTTIVVPLAMNLHSRVLTKVRFRESIPITSSYLLPMDGSTGPRAGQGCYDAQAKRSRESPRAIPPHVNWMGGLCI